MSSMVRCLAWGAAALLLSFPSISPAAETAQFDVPPIVACRDVSTAAFVQQNPGERLWEARLHVSVLVAPAAADRLSQLLVRFDNPRRRLRVVDFAPRTSLTSDVQGSIRRDYHAETSKTFDFQLRGMWPGVGDGEAKGSSRSHFTTDEATERLPPLDLCVASGTTQRSSGVYFKLHATTQTTLEGNHAFVVWFAAPESWVGDQLRVQCSAFVRGAALGMVPGDEAVLASQRQFGTALYREGDESGRAAAERLVRAEGELRWAVARQTPPIPIRHGGDFVGDLTTRWTGRDPRLPADWFQQFVYGAGAIDTATLNRLPPKVRVAVERYVAAQQTLVGWHRGTALPGRRVVE